MNVYWSGLLLLENTIFYACLYTLPSFGWLAAACWIPALLINIWIAKKHLTPVLCTMLDYEKIYYPLPDDGSAGPLTQPEAIRASAWALVSPWSGSA